MKRTAYKTDNFEAQLPKFVSPGGLLRMFNALYQWSKYPFFGGVINFFGYGYLAVWNKVVSHVPSYWLRYFVAKYLFGLKIGRSNLHGGVRFLSPWNIVIGDNVNIQMDCFLDGRGGLEIGNNVDVTMGVKILTQQHDIDTPDYKTVSRKVTIGDDAIVGSYALVMPGVVIGVGAVIAAGSVVVKDVPPFEMHAGNPAVFKRCRRTKIEYQLNYRRPFH